MAIVIPNRLMPLGRKGLSTPTAESYIQDGLVAMWDGIENAGWGVHDPNATTWKDLVGSDDLTIYGTVQDNSIATTNTAAAGGAFVIPGIATIEVCYGFRNYSPNRNQGIVFCSGNMTTADSRIGIIQYGPDVGFQTFYNRFYSYNQVGSLTRRTVSATTTSCFCNGIELQAVSHGNDSWSNNDYTLIGGRANAGHIWCTFGDYFNIRLYSRALTAAEIAANYAVDKARFGLPTT